MTRDEAHALLNFIQKRIFAWTLALGCNNPSGRMDGRYRIVKVADQILRDAFLSRTPLDECIAAFERDEDPALQWPEAYQDFARFCLWHRCPRDVNEPLNEAMEADLPRVEWPDFICQYDKPATLDDMPPLPKPSDRLLALKRAAKGTAA